MLNLFGCSCVRACRETWVGGAKCPQEDQVSMYDALTLIDFSLFLVYFREVCRTGNHD